MREIEVKILDIDKKEIEEKLLELGAKKVLDDKLYALLFDSKDGSFRKSGNTLRLRRLGNKTILTFKKHISQEKAKIKDETEVEVFDFDKTKKILESLGFVVYRKVKKHRTSYKLGNVRFELDSHEEKYKFIPDFLEIEAKDIETIYKFAKILGFKEKDCKPWSLKDLIKHYSQEK